MSALYVALKHAAISIYLLSASAPRAGRSMQEGLLSLMQMAKTAAALTKLSES